MSQNSPFAFTDAFRDGLPEPIPRFTGLPKYNFVYGHNDPSEVPAKALAQIASKTIERDGALLGKYNLGHGPQGHEGLRDFVAKKVARTREIAVTRDDVAITSGSLQGMDLVNQVLLEPGDTVILEQFTYGGAIAKAQGRGAHVIGAPLDSGGLDMKELRRILEDLQDRGVRPKYIYTIPTVQNPTGSILSLERRRELIALSREFAVPIFEDECYADVRWAAGDAPPALYGLAPEQVIHIGSFSKSLAPALRVGYIIAGWTVLSQLLACKGDGGTGALEQMVVAEYFSQAFEGHLARLTPALREKLDTIVEALEREFGTDIEIFMPEGGIFVWVKLPDEIDVRSFADVALEQGVAFNPGPDWACHPEEARSHMRLCFALPSKRQIQEGIAELARICHENTGVPVRGANVARG